MVVELMNAGPNSSAEGENDTENITEDAQTRTPESQPRSTPEQDHENDNVAESPGVIGNMSTRNGETSYVGAAHWEAILDGVCNTNAVTTTIH